MVSIGSKALPLRRAKACDLTEEYLMGGGNNPNSHGGRKNMNRKALKKYKGSDEGDKSHYGGPSGANFQPKQFQDTTVSQTSFLRKRVDPETAKYFAEISNVIEGTEIDLEERSSICGNALEETRGKEVELATDYIISHTLQTLLEGCGLDHLCDFLQNCSKDFPRISMDRSGSHVAETALRSLAMHLHGNENQSLIEDTLTLICQGIVVSPVDVMCDCYGSHVLRSLLCLCKGVSLDSSEFHAKKSSTVLAERLNFRPRSNGNETRDFQMGFPDLLKYLVSEILKASKNEIEALQVDQYSSLVLQTALKLLDGHEQELLHIIPIVLGCSRENTSEGNLIETSAAKSLLSLMKETAFSHLMEVILEVAPENIYNELITKVFRSSIFEMSSHQCGNFVIQALISHARSEEHVEMIWNELGGRFKDLFEMSRSGVVASLLATSHRLHSHEHKCCQALANAVSMENETSKCIVPRILFLDSYIWCKDKSDWNWPDSAKMHVIGTLILQSVFRLQCEFIHVFISSITSLEAEHVLHMAKDSGGARVIEAFLSSNASGKHKRKLVVRLRGHFGELSLHQSGSFTVGKCFDVSNLSLREAIVSELVAVQTELSKTKQGPHLSRKLDVDGYAKRPDQWKSRQASKESVYKDFISVFGTKEAKPFKTNTFTTENNSKTQQEKLKDMRKEIDTRLASAHPPSSDPRSASKSKGSSSGKLSKRGREDAGLKGKEKKQKRKRYDAKSP